MARAAMMPAADTSPATAPLDYERAGRPRRPWRMLVAFSLVVALLLVVIGWLWVQRERSLRQALMAERMALAAALAAQNLAAAEQAASIERYARLIPAEGLEITLKQREERWLAGRTLKLSIDDITGGQVLVTVSDADENVLLGPASVREGDVIDFADAGGVRLRLEVLELTNRLVGDDLATFRLTAPDAAPEDAAAASQPALSEAQKVELLLARIAALEGATFIRNGGEHSAAEAVEHLRMKWRESGLAGEPGATAALFIEHAASRSSLSGRPYRIRLSDGSEVESAAWLREQLAEIEHGGEGTNEPAAAPANAEPATRPAGRG